MVVVVIDVLLKGSILDLADIRDDLVLHPLDALPKSGKMIMKKPDILLLVEQQDVLFVPSELQDGQVDVIDDLDDRDLVVDRSQVLEFEKNDGRRRQGGRDQEEHNSVPEMKTHRY